MFELKVHPEHTNKSGVSWDQWVTEEGYAVPHAVWFHGVTQEDFWPTMCIWPPWNPALEVPKAAQKAAQKVALEVPKAAQWDSDDDDWGDWIALRKCAESVNSCSRP